MVEKVGCYYKTDDYSKFRFLDGNRSVTEMRVNKIIDSVNKVGQIESPLIINEKNEIIDGQARFKAFKKLGLPIYYIKKPGIGLKECIAMNMFQSNWTLKDYINSYAETGNGSYQYLRNLTKAFPNYSINVILNAAKGVTGNGNSTVKDGAFSCTEEEYLSALAIMDYQKNFDVLLSKVGGRKDYYYYVIAFAYRLDLIDKNRLLNKALSMPLEFVPVAKIDQALDVVEKIYNDRNRNKVYMGTEYKRMLDGKYSWYSSRKSRNKWTG